MELETKMAYKRRRGIKRRRISRRRRYGTSYRRRRYSRRSTRGVRRFVKRAYRIAKGECYYYDYESEVLTTTSNSWSAPICLTRQVGDGNTTSDTGDQKYGVGSERNSSLRGTQILGRYLALNFMNWTGINTYSGYMRVIIARCNEYCSVTPDVKEILDANTTFMTFKRVGDTKYVKKWTILRDKLFRFNNAFIRNHYWRAKIRTPWKINYAIEQIDPDGNSTDCGPGNIFMWYCWAGLSDGQMNGSVLFKTRLRYYDP